MSTTNNRLTAEELQKLRQTDFMGKPGFVKAETLLTKEIGEIDDVKLAIRHQPGKTIYEMAFSPVAVSPFRLIAGSSCRLNVLVNLSDGTRRIGWLQLSHGMGDNPFRPAEFLDVALAK